MVFRLSSQTPPTIRVIPAIIGIVIGSFQINTATKAVAAVPTPDQTAYAIPSGRIKSALEKI